MGEKSHFHGEGVRERWPNSRCGGRENGGRVYVYILGVHQKQINGREGENEKKNFQLEEFAPSI